MESGHKFPSIKRIVENIAFNQDIAIVMGQEVQQPVSMTPNHEEWITRRFTNVWIKTKNGCKLASRQSSKVFID